MKRNTTVKAGEDGASEDPDLRLTVDIAGRRLVYAESDLETIGFRAGDL